MMKYDNVYTCLLTFWSRFQYSDFNIGLIRYITNKLYSVTK